MPVQKYPKGSQIWVSKHFQAREFDCPCKACLETLLDSDLVEGLERMRERLGCPVKITSGYRCAAHQLELSAQGYETAKNSQHLAGKAADVWTGKHTGHLLEICARSSGFKAVGVASAWVHVDLRADRVRLWYYTRR